MRPAVLDGELADQREPAELAFGGGARQEQIQLALGHASARTIERNAAEL